MYGRGCPECGYSSHDENGTDYHNNCLSNLHQRNIKLAFFVGLIASFTFFGCCWYLLY